MQHEIELGPLRCIIDSAYQVPAMSFTTPNRNGMLTPSTLLHHFTFDTSQDPKVSKQEESFCLKLSTHLLITSLISHLKFSNDSTCPNPEKHHSFTIKLIK